MNYEKDIQNQTDNKTFNQTDINKEPLLNNAFSEFATKKTQKLVTALYMVTDCMESDEALKLKMRSLGVDLLSDIHKFTSMRATDKHFSVSSCVFKINEIISFVEIASIIGFVSEMNTNILKSEFDILSKELLKYQDKNQASISENSAFINSSVPQFTINKESLSTPLPVYAESASLAKPFWYKELEASDSKGQVKDNKQIMSFTKKHEILSHKNKTEVTNSFLQKSFSKEEKSDRKSKIIELINSKKNSPNGQTGVSIKDISSSFIDCSEKTIQRELNDLVQKGQIRKSGEKRWSRYHVL